ncbi:CPXV054 protein, partial [Monkeypox virus]
RHTIESVYF